MSKRPWRRIERRNPSDKSIFVRLDNSWFQVFGKNGENVARSYSPDALKFFQSGEAWAAHIILQHFAGCKGEWRQETS